MHATLIHVETQLAVLREVGTQIITWSMQVNMFPCYFRFD